MFRKLCRLVPPMLLVVAATVAVTAQVPADVYKLTYFANNSPTANQVIRIINPGTVSDSSPAGDLCAAVYVFNLEQLNACCSCRITPNGGIALNVYTNLTSNTLLGKIPSAGVVKVVSSLPVGGTCDPTHLSATPTLRGWATHHQNGQTNVTDEELEDSPLSSAEYADLQEDCTVLEELGSGAGICSCGTSF